MDACEFFLLRYWRLHEIVMQSLLTELTDNQIRCRPVAGVNTIAWIVWHVARAEDIAVNRFVAHSPQLFFDGGWGTRMNVPYSDFGVGMTADEVSDLSARIDLDALRAYWVAVEQRALSVVAGLRAQDLDEDNTPPYILQVVDGDGIFRAAGRWGEGFWTDMPNRTKGFFLAYLVLSYGWMQHGEAFATRSLLGMPGR